MRSGTGGPVCSMGQEVSNSPMYCFVSMGNLEELEKFDVSIDNFDESLATLGRFVNILKGSIFLQQSLKGKG